MTFEEIISRNAYLLTVEVRLYWLVAFIYALAALLSIFYVFTRTISIAKSARGLMWVGVVLHIALVVLRTSEVARAPFQTLYESLSWFALSATLTYLVVSHRWKDVFLPALPVSVLSAGACLYALFSRSPAAEPLSPPLQSYWFEWHVFLAFTSYAVFVVSSAIEASCLIVAPLKKKGLASSFGFSEPGIERLRSTANKLVVFGFPLLTFAIFSGAAWANEAWGRYWSWDPKETWSLITWSVFTMYLHASSVRSWRSEVSSALNILGFICMMMTFLGVNWLAKLLGIPSLHIYAV